MSKLVFEQVQTLAADVFGVPRAAITAASSPTSIEKWDSLQNTNLVLALEEMFGIEFEVEEIERMKNVGVIVEIIEAKIA